MKLSPVFIKQLTKLLYGNPLLPLLNSKNEPYIFDIDRHICRNLNDIIGKNKEEKIYNSILMAIFLWSCWEIEIRNSNYPLNWYGCIQIQDDWIKDGTGAPPEVIFNSEYPDKVKFYDVFKTCNINEFPVKINFFKYLFPYNKIILKKAYFEPDLEVIPQWSGGYIWRICAD